MRKEIGKAIETLYDETRNWRVIIFRNADGSYGLEWERYIPRSEEEPHEDDDGPYEAFWITMRYSVTFCDSLETARREAVGRLSAKEFPQFKP